MKDLIVIGRGYWGAAICYEAKCAGLSVLVVDSGDRLSGSRNASGVADPKAYQSSVFRRYWPSDWTKQDLEDSFNWLRSRGGYPVTEWFWNHFQNRELREGPRCLYIPYPAHIERYGTPFIPGEVVRGSIGDTVQLELKDGKKLEARNLAVAAGYHTDTVLERLGLERNLLGVKPLYGRGLNLQGSPIVETPVSVMIRPYVKHTVRTWKDGMWKLGDTAEIHPNPKKLESLQEVGKIVFGGKYKVHSVSEGFRPVCDRFVVEKVASRVVVATGGHRLGLGLAGLVGKKVVEAIQ